MEKTKVLNDKLKLFFEVLFFGSLWGLAEATLGTVLHLPFFEAGGMYLASSTIMLPIAYFLMANCYKRTGKLYSVAMMGILAGLIKLTVAFVIGFIDRVYCPAIYIVVESLAMVGALAVFRPKNVLSLRTLAAMILANTSYQFAYLGLRVAFGSSNPFASLEAWANVGEKYLFKINCVAILYSFAIGAIFYGIFQLAKHYNWELKFDYKKIVYSPITASIMFAVAIGLTITFAALK